MKKNLLLTLLGCFTVFYSFSTTKTAVSNTSYGWSTASNWSPAGVPASGDIVVIPVGVTLSVKGGIYSTQPDILMYINGTLDFDPSGKLDLGSNSFVVINSTGQITSNSTGSEKIMINGVTKFQGSVDGSLVGPSFSSSSTGASPSGFAVAIVLPLKLVDFRNTVQNNQVILNWKLVAAADDNYFDIEKMDEAGNWKLISTQKVPANNAVAIEGNFTDHNPLGNKNYYRLKMKNADGSFNYSKVIEAQLGNAQASFTFFPNPCKGNLQMQLGSTLKEGSVYICNATGKIVYQQPINNQLTASLQLSTLPKGLYTIVFKSGDNQQSKSFIINQ